MSFKLTEKARIEADKINKEPQIVLDISGLTTKFSGVSLKKYIRIGDDGLLIGDTWRIGGFNEVEDSSPYITFDRGTSSRIQQSVDADKGETTSITSMSITVIDKNEEVSALLKPDDTQSPTFDLLGRECKVWFGFKESGWKDDYIVIFRGIIESHNAGGGYVTFNLTSSEKIIDSVILPKVELELAASLSAGATEIQLSPTGQISLLQENIPDPSQAGATGFNSYLRVDDEVIQIEDINATGIGTATRGALGTTATTHDSGAAAESIYELQGKPMDIAKRLLVGSDSTDPADYGNRYLDLTAGLITNYVRITSTRTESNGILFRGQNLKEEYGIIVGDIINAVNAASGTQPENICSGDFISDIELLDDGSTVVFVEDDTGTPKAFTEELATTGSIVSFLAKDSIYWTVGLKINPNLVDIEEMDKLQNRFFSSTYLSYYIKDSIDLKEFIEQDLFKPLSLYRVPKNGRFSLSYHFPPLPDEEIVTLDSSNVVNPNELVIGRSTSENFYNSVAIRYNENLLEDKFDGGYVTLNATSKARIPVGRKTLTIDGTGFRTDKTIDGNATAGATYAATAADRRLSKYAFGAEYIKKMKVNFKTGYSLDIGDIVNVNLSDLKLTDIKSGTRSGAARLFEIENKTLNLKTGEIEISLVDTNFNLDARYALMSPASLVKSGVSQSQFVIKPRTLQPTKQFGANEYRKWSNKIGASLLVRNADFSVSGIATLASVSSNTLTLSSNLGFVPVEGYTVELSPFANQDSLITNLYGFMSEGATGAMSDASIAYQMV